MSTGVIDPHTTEPVLWLPRCDWWIEVYLIVQDHLHPIPFLLPCTLGVWYPCDSQSLTRKYNIGVKKKLSQGNCHTCTQVYRSTERPPSQCPTGSDWSQVDDRDCFSSSTGSNPRLTSYTHMLKQRRTGTRLWGIPTCDQVLTVLILLTKITKSYTQGCVPPHDLLCDQLFDDELESASEWLLFPRNPVDNLRDIVKTITVTEGIVKTVTEGHGQPRRHDRFHYNGLRVTISYQISWRILPQSPCWGISRVHFQGQTHILPQVTPM